MHSQIFHYFRVVYLGILFNRFFVFCNFIWQTQISSFELKKKLFYKRSFDDKTFNCHKNRLNLILDRLTYNLH